jgi:hypothetical protein
MKMVAAPACGCAALIKLGRARPDDHGTERACWEMTRGGRQVVT